MSNDISIILITITDDDLLLTSSQYRLYFFHSREFPSFYSFYISDPYRSGVSPIHKLFETLNDRTGFDFMSQLNSKNRNNLETKIDRKLDIVNDGRKLVTEIENKSIRGEEEMEDDEMEEEEEEGERRESENEITELSRAKNNLEIDNELKNGKIKREKNKFGPYADTVGKGRMFRSNEELRMFLEDSTMTQKVKRNILISEKEKIERQDKENKYVMDNGLISNNRVSYIGKIINKNDVNHCFIDFYVLICNGNEIIESDDKTISGEWFTLNDFYIMFASNNEGIELTSESAEVWNSLLLFLKQKIKL